MAKIFLGIAIVFTLCSVALSLKTKSKVSDIRVELTAAKDNTAALTADKNKAVAEVKQAKEELEVSKTAKEVAETAATASKADLEKLRAEAAEKAAKLAKTEADLKEAADKLASATPAPAATPDPEVVKRAEEAETKAKEQALLAEAAQSKAKEAEAKAQALEDEKHRREVGLSKPGLEGKVLAVNPNWNFVVLNIGDHQGVAMNSTLVIKRAGSLVAKLRISSVEPSTAIADIIAGSVARGTTVQPGDVVIFSGS